MEFKAFASGVNVVTLEKDGRFYAMTVAWGMMCDYDCVLLLLGGQSDTGKALSKGDHLGITALADGQRPIGEAIGSCHSLQQDKRTMAPFQDFNGVSVIKGGKVKMRGEVIEVYHLPRCPEDNLVYVRVMEQETDGSKSFLVL